MASNKKTAAHPPPQKTVPAPSASPTGNGASPSSADALRKLYASLLRCRLVQERVRDSPAADGYDVAIGREAIVAGATANLGIGDMLAVSPRNLGALVAAGAPLAALFTSNGQPLSAAGTFTSEDPFNWGAGIALAHRLEHKQNVVAAVAAQPAPSLDTWHDALKFAAAHQLPILFIIENGVATAIPAAGESPHLDPISFFAREYGFPGIVVDGNDVVAVWRVVQESVHRARYGSGPTLVDCRTDATRDPLAHMEHYLRKRDAWEDGWNRQLQAEITAALDEALAARSRSED